MDSLPFGKHLLELNEVDLRWLARFTVIDDKSVLVDAHQGVVSFPEVVGIGDVWDSQHLYFLSRGVEHVNSVLSLELRREEEELARVSDEARLRISIIISV